MKICYFFVKYRLYKNYTTVEYCPTHLVIADYFTNPLQGKAFKTFFDVIMGYAHINNLLTVDLPIEERVEKETRLNLLKNKQSRVLINN